MSSEKIQNKWDRIYEKSSVTDVAQVLAEHHHLLPSHGKALDLACGLGANALFLAEHGLETEAWDISPVALNKLQHSATEKNLQITTKQVSIKPNSLPKEHFNVIIIARFLDRSLTNAIMESLKSGGLIFYQTYVKEKTGSKGPNNPAFLLSRNELLQLFQPLTTVFYKENSLLGNVDIGERNEALFIGQKE
jgi:2-polyprenyl-3-methyl-5-hydroxy-6-metoxy-1,4-benzoquinol methylase